MSFLLFATWAHASLPRAMLFVARATRRPWSILMSGCPQRPDGCESIGGNLVPADLRSG